MASPPSPQPNDFVASIQQHDSSSTLTDDSSSSSAALITNEHIHKYEKIDYHWFYTKTLQEKIIWVPFSYKDSKNIESIYINNEQFIENSRKDNLNRSYKEEDEGKYLVTVVGGRFEVNLIELKKKSIYWDSKESDIKRCLWFYKESNEQRYKPYDQVYCEFLEKEYENTLNTNEFHKHIRFNKSLLNASNDGIQAQHSIDDADDEAFIFHSTTIMLHFVQSSMIDEFGNLNSDAQRPRIVKRGVLEVVDKVEPDEPDCIDHLCFIVHGIGEGCDMKFRPIVDCVDDFREMSNFITQSHFKSHLEAGKLTRIEYIPISWHEELHGDPTGIDERLSHITLEWIPKLRKFANTTITDVLFYTSPIYCQTIISKVGNELNRLYRIFKQRNTTFNGTVSLIGHSLGSLILYDLLEHQSDQDVNQSIKQMPLNQQINDISKFLTDLGLSEFVETFKKEKIDETTLLTLSEDDLKGLGLPLGSRRALVNAISQQIAKNERDIVHSRIRVSLDNLRQLGHRKSVDYEYGLAGTGQLLIKYPRLEFNVENFFALGSPIAMFLTVRGIETLSEEFKLPYCKGFFNIFHPYDPIAYRIEPLICPKLTVKPVLMPHHLGRKRMHLEIREGLAKVGGDLKQKMMDKLKTTWSSIQDFANSHKPSQLIGPNVPSIEQDASQVTREDIEQVKLGLDDETKDTEDASGIGAATTSDELNIKIGCLNGGRRIDYVLQERVFETFNEYLFALASHVYYWESEDTILMIVKEIYSEFDTKPNQNQQLPGMAAIEQQSKIIAQVAASTFNSTLNYFKSALPQSLITPSAPQQSKPDKI